MKRVLVPVLATVTVATIAVLLATSPSEPTGERPTGEKVPKRPVVADSLDAFYFETLDQMVATSDIVVEGTISSKSGVIFEDGQTDSETKTGYKEAVLQVSRVHWVRGNLGIRSGSNLLIGELAWQGGRDIVLPGEGTTTGESGFYFLHLKGADAEQEMFRTSVINAQGRFLQDAAGNVVGTGPEDPLVQTLDAMSAEELRNEIGRSVEKVQRGQIEPVHPPAICPPDRGCASLDEPYVETEAQGSYSEPDAQWSCSAAGIGGVAVETTVARCYVYDSTNSNTILNEARPVSMNGGLAATVAAATYRPATGFATLWLCWETSAKFLDGSVARDDSCRLLPS